MFNFESNWKFNFLTRFEWLIFYNRGTHILRRFSNFFLSSIYTLTRQIRRIIVQWIFNECLFRRKHKDCAFLSVIEKNHEKERKKKECDIHLQISIGSRAPRKSFLFDRSLKWWGEGWSMNRRGGLNSVAPFSIDARDMHGTAHRFDVDVFV